jgi:peptidoglycan hydrolase-like protein with peptidoglycan-binding domain
MDSYSYIELALVWENPTELKFVEGLKWQKLSSQAYIRLLSVALILSVLSVAGSASAALKPGDNGEQVRTLQQRLKDLGHFPRNQETSIFYRRITEDAVSKFQRTYAAYGLKATGVADDFTLYYLGLGSYPTNPTTRSIPAYPPSSGQARTIRTCDGWRFGDKGYTIRNLQQKLKALGYFYGGVDGKYRERTRDAVTRFQKVNSLTPTGCVDYNTLVAINQGITEISYSYPPTTYPLPRSNPGQNFDVFTLRRNSRGELVRQLQTYLKNLGFNPGAIDEVFGNDTEYAVKQFQQSVGLYPDGIATTHVQSILRNTIARNQAIPYGTPLYYPVSTLGYR